LPLRKTISLWSEEWKAHDEWLRQLQSCLKAQGIGGSCGGGYDNWDLEVQGGVLAGIRTKFVVEEHGGGRQMLRFRIWPRWSGYGLFLLILIGSLSLAAAYNHSWTATALLGGMSLFLGGRLLYESGTAMHQVTQVLKTFTTQAEILAGGTGVRARTVKIRVMGSAND
jgi:hypothetical protein